MAEFVVKKPNTSFKTDSVVSALDGRRLELNLDKLLTTSDTNRDGRIDPKEFEGNRPLSLSERNTLNRQFRYFDIDGDGAITPHDDVNNNQFVDVDDRRDFASSERKKLSYNELKPSKKVSINTAVAREESAMLRKAESIIPTRPPVTLTTVLPKEEYLNASLPAVAISEVNFFNAPINNLNPKLEGLKILHLSDLHLNRLRDSSRLDELGKLISKLPSTPDLIVVTGDFIQYSTQGFDKTTLKILDSIFPKVPRLAVLGNHDFYSVNKDGIVIRFPKGEGSSTQVQERLEEIGFVVLRNQTVRTIIRGAPINFTGVEDFSRQAHQPPTAPVAPSDELSIFLTHNLDTLNNTVPKNYDLVLSGHTHSGELDLVVYNGFDWIKGRDFINLNDQVRGIKPLTWRTTSFISPGFSRRVGVRMGPGVENSGITLLTLKNYSAK